MNDTDDGEVIPPGFRFIKETVARDGVQPAEDNFRTGCDCLNDDECMFETCDCLGELEGDDSDDDDSSDELSRGATNGSNGARPARKQRRPCFAYNSSGPKAGLLRGHILQSRQPIYECHERCKCSKSCPNRVVERGRQIPLQIFRTNDRGWGK